MEYFNNKTKALEIIYHIYEDFTSGIIQVCEKGCASCCTRNLSLTSLEAAVIMEYLYNTNNSSLLDSIKKTYKADRFIPETTFNGLAEICIRDEDLPEEESSPSWGSCPLLKKDDDTCAIYPVRPFGCRCMTSSINCHKSGFARMKPFVASVNNLFMQFIEHLDQKGLFGNLFDMLLYFESDGSLENYKNGKIFPRGALLLNRPIPALMIPPEHRKKIQPILQSLQNIKI